MAKRPRRRIIVLESDDDDDEEQEAENSGRSRALPVAPTDVQTGVKSETSSRRKLQKLDSSVRKNLRPRSQQPAVSSLFDSGWKSSSVNVPHGAFPLEVITKQTAKAEESSLSRKGKGPAKPEDHQRTSLKNEVDYRLWVDKYTPRSVGELVVHPKKVAEVKDWLQGQLQHPYGSLSGSRVLILSGSAGVGKTAVVHALADVLGVELIEWTAPVPELWQEFSHHAAAGGTYVSKLDEFEAFVERGRKMCSLPIVRVALSTSQRVRPFSGHDRVVSPVKSAKVLLIDDLPIVNGREHKQRLAKNLFRLALSRDFPTIVVITEEIGTGVRVGERDEHKGVLETLESGGAKKIAFNPVTVNAMKKLLMKVQLLEKCRLSSDSMCAIAERSAGDIRQALSSLQFLCLGYHSPTVHHLMWDPGGIGSTQYDRANLQIKGVLWQETALSRNSYPGAGAGRDYSLSLFHALGKFLHNKRLTDEQFRSGTSTLSQVKEELRRYPLDMEDPEVIVSQAQTDSATLLAFLHENVLQFIDEDATDDVGAVSAYLSDADCFLGAPGSFRSRNIFIHSNDVDPSQVAIAVANSVAARGVLFGNGHPAPRRWQSLRAPALWQVERQNKRKKMEMSNQGLNGIIDARVHSGLVKATEFYPFSRHLSGRDPSTSSPNVVDASNIIEVEDSMQRDERNSVLQFGIEKGVEQEHFVLETTLMRTCVEDDIEDPDD